MNVKHFKQSAKNFKVRWKSESRHCWNFWILVNAQLKRFGKQWIYRLHRYFIKSLSNRIKLFSRYFESHFLMRDLLFKKIYLFKIVFRYKNNFIDLLISKFIRILHSNLSFITITQVSSIILLMWIYFSQNYFEFKE